MALTEEIPQEKRKEKDSLVEKMKNYDTVAIANLRDLPSAQLHSIKKALRSDVKMKVSKKTIIKLALEEADEGLEGMKDEVSGMPILLFTNKGAFELSKILRQNKMPAAARPGDVAPKHIKVEEGMTPFSPGPMISKLSSIGLQPKVESGKIKIVETSVVIEEGEEFSEDVADILLRLDKKPMRVGLSLEAAFEDGVVYGSEDLSFDSEEIKDDLIKAHKTSFSLSIGMSYPIKENIGVLLSNAHTRATILAAELNIVTEDNVGTLLSKGKAHAKALNEKLDSKKDKKGD